MGSVAIPLPYKAVVGEQFANNFTGLVGGTVATTALVIRFFQKQGQKVAVAASSGVLNSLASMVVQAILVVTALIFTSGDFTPSDSGGGKGIAGFVIILIVVGGVGLAVALVVPKLRRRLQGVVAPQLGAAKENLKGILTTPRKAAMLFGGNLVTQVLFALVLEAALARVRRVAAAAPGHPDQLARVAARRHGPGSGRHGRGRGRAHRWVHRRGHPADPGGRGDVHRAPVHRVPAADLGLVRAAVAAPERLRVASVEVSVAGRRVRVGHAFARQQALLVEHVEERRARARS